MSGLVGLPPLPVVQEVAALTMFLVESLDDAVEDALKLSLLAVVWCGIWRLLRTRRVLMQGFRFCGIIMVYPAADRAADAAGHIMAPIQDSMYAQHYHLFYTSFCCSALCAG